MTPEEKRRLLSGICCYNLLGLTSLAAFICGVYSYAMCDFLSRSITLSDDYTPGDYETACSDLGYGSANALDAQICQSVMQNHGIGFTYWQATIPVDQKMCFSYTQLAPWGWVVPEFDTKFNTSRAFSIIGFVFGGAAWLTLLCSSCCRIDQQRLKGIGCYFMIACFSHGLSLLMFDSNVCEKGFFEPYFVPSSQKNNITYLDNFNSIVKDVECTMSFGSKMAISATVLFFVCTLMVPFAVVPFYEQRSYQCEYQSVQRQGGPEQASSPPPPTGKEPVVEGHVTGNV
eukprot:jgi/Psemu1/184374/e_gw1.39.73.1